MVSDFKQLHDVLSQYRQSKVWCFRGHADERWKLVPKIGRPPYFWVNERRVLESWKRRALQYVTHSIRSDWDWLAIAQHHGLATRLLDWSTNPLNAAFFAVREQWDGNAVIYAARFYQEQPRDDDDPFEVRGVFSFFPRGVVPRIIRQGGLFTIQETPTIALEDGVEGLEELHKIIVAQAYRSELLSELSFYGINDASLFPDLDGLGGFLNWTIESKEYWNRSSEE